MPKLMLVGHGRAGKDEAGEYLQKITGLKFAGTTSLYLAKYVARKMGVTEAEAYRDRHKNRDHWYRIGNEIREGDPGILIRESLLHGDIVGGVRDIEEVIYARAKGIVDLVIWIENIWVPVDPTVKFTSRECDIVVQNNWDLQTYHERLRRLASALGITKGTANAQAESRCEDKSPKFGVNHEAERAAQIYHRERLAIRS